MNCSRASATTTSEPPPSPWSCARVPGTVRFVSARHPLDKLREVQPDRIRLRPVRRCRGATAAARSTRYPMWNSTDDEAARLGSLQGLHDEATVRRLRALGLGPGLALPGTREPGPARCARLDGRHRWGPRDGDRRRPGHGPAPVAGARPTSRSSRTTSPPWRSPTTYFDVIHSRRSSCTSTAPTPWWPSSSPPCGPVGSSSSRRPTGRRRPRPWIPPPPSGPSWCPWPGAGPGPGACPTLLDELGLEDVHDDVRDGPLTGATPVGAFWQHTLRSIRAFLTDRPPDGAAGATPMDDATIDAMVALLDDPAFVMPFALRHNVSGRRPGGVRPPAVTRAVVDGVELYYEVEGTGPRLLLISGTGGDCAPPRSSTDRAPGSRSPPTTNGAWGGRRSPPALHHGRLRRRCRRPARRPGLGGRPGHGHLLRRHGGPGTGPAPPGPGPSAGAGLHVERGRRGRLLSPARARRPTRGRGIARQSGTGRHPLRQGLAGRPIPTNGQALASLLRARAADRRRRTGPGRRRRPAARRPSPPRHLGPARPDQPAPRSSAAASTTASPRRPMPSTWPPPLPGAACSCSTADTSSSSRTAPPGPPSRRSCPPEPERLAHRPTERDSAGGMLTGSSMSIHPAGRSALLIASLAHRTPSVGVRVGCRRSRNGPEYCRTRSRRLADAVAAAVAVAAVACSVLAPASAAGPPPAQVNADLPWHRAVTDAAAVAGLVRAATGARLRPGAPARLALPGARDS